MLTEFGAEAVANDVLEHLERRRPAIVADPALVEAEVQRALAPIRRSYQDADLPAVYLKALEEEILATVPARWRAVALPFTEEGSGRSMGTARRISWSPSADRPTR